MLLEFFVCYTYYDLHKILHYSLTPDGYTDEREGVSQLHPARRGEPVLEAGDTVLPPLCSRPFLRRHQPPYQPHRTHFRHQPYDEQAGALQLPLSAGLESGGGRRDLCNKIRSDVHT